MSPRPIAPDDLTRFRWVDHVRFSPSGERVAYQVTWADLDLRQNRGRVMVGGVEPGAPARELRADARRDHSPEWSPDGTRIAFLARKGPRDQLVVAPADGGEAVQLSAVPDGVLGLSWAPDGRSLAFAARVVGDPASVVDDPRPPEGEEQARRPPIARVARTLAYKRDGVGYFDGRHTHVLLVPAGGGEARALTSGAWSVEGFTWAPDGRSCAILGDAEPDADLRRGNRLYVVDVATGARRPIAGDLMMSAPAWSPRGDLVAFVAPIDLEAGRLERVWVAPVDGGGDPRCLTVGYDRSVGDSVLTDMRGGHGTRLCWSDDGERVSFVASGPGAAAVCSVGLDGRVAVEVPAERRVVYDFDVAGGAVAACVADPANPGDVVLVRPGQGEETRLTDANGWLRGRALATQERHVFTAPDGLEIEGWLLRPPDLDPARRHPLVLQVHGGPHAQYGWAFFHEFQVLAGMGILVLGVNPRGSDGYGEGFRRAVVRDWGGRDYQDLMAALDQAIERTGLVDERRLGVAGGSYGGFMTNWAIGHTDRFAAAVSMRSISNLVSEFAQHDLVLWGELEMGPRPWPDPDELWLRSPIRYVHEMRTPLLLLHSEMDLRCAVSQAEELFGALRLLGREVEMVRFPGESHDLSRSGRPDRRIERLRRIAGWLERYLLDRAESPGEDRSALTSPPAAAP